MRPTFLIAALCVCAVSVAGVGVQPGGEGAAGGGQPAAKKDVGAAKGARFVARLAPGQVAVYEVYETDSQKKDEVKRSRVRVEVLRVTEEGVVVRGTDFWEGKDKSVRPAPMGESPERTGEVTFDVLVPWDGSEVRAADRAAALSEMIGQWAAEQRKKGEEEEKIGAAAERMRGILESSSSIDTSTRRQFGVLFNGLGAAVVASAGEPVGEETQIGALTVKSRRRTGTVIDGRGRAVRTESSVTSADEHRRILREITRNIAKEQGVDAAEVEKALAPQLVKMRDSEVKTVITSDPATGWPAESKWTSDKQSKGVDVVQARTLTLVEGPEPVVPAPTEGARDEGSDGYVEWLVALVGAKERPVRAYGRMLTDGIDSPTASQRKILLEGAVGAGAGAGGQAEDEEPAAVTLAAAGSISLEAGDAEAVSAAYAKLTPVARRVVLVNVLRVKEGWAGALFARLLALSPTEQDVDGLPLRAVAKDAALANRALKAALAGTKPGAFDWEVLLSGYSLNEEDALDSGVSDALFARAAAALGRQVEAAKPQQQAAHGNWVYEGEYPKVNALLALAADVLGAAKGDVGLAELRECAKLTDERASGFAVASLVNRGEKVDAATVERLCRGATGWYSLVSQLEKGKESAVPEGARTVEMAARADMVRWLVYPTELGREPEAIELVKTVDGEGGEGKERYYIFKFRSEHASFKEKGWMMGLSGPWDPAGPFTQRAGGHTFSEFEAVGKSTPEEQAAGIIKKLQEAWKKELEKVKGAGEKEG